MVTAPPPGAEAEAVAMLIALIGGVWLLVGALTAVAFGRTMENGGSFRIERELVRLLDLNAGPGASPTR